MALIWHDSLHYANTTRLLESYPSAVAVTTGGAHPHSGKESIGMVDASVLPIPAVSTPADDTVYVGFRLKVLVAPGERSDFMEIRTSGGTPLIKMKIEASGNGVKFIFVRGDERLLLMESSTFDAISEFIYIEVRAIASNGGQIELRVDGVRDRYIEDINTVGSVIFPWNNVQFVPQDNAPGTLASYLFSDLYVADGSNNFSFLGPVNVTRMFPALQETLGWAPSLRIRKKLVVYAGQSNVNGRGELPYTGGSRNPNTKVKLWNGSSWGDVTAGVGSHPFYTGVGTPWAAEMSFSEEVASLYEISDDTAATEVHFLRLGADSSTVFPSDVVYPSWHPTVPSNLTDAAMVIVQAAVSGLGGWSELDHVDMFWYQGESETENTSTYIANTLAVFAEFETQFDVPIKWHRMLIQPELPSTFENVDGLRQLQQSPLLPGTIIDTKGYGFAPDGIHMSENGQEDLGRAMFAKWSVSQLFADYLKNYYNDDLDLDYWHGSDTANTETTFLQAPEVQFDLVHSPVKALNNRMLRESSNDGKNLVLTIGDTALPTVALDAVGAWTFKYVQMSGNFAPESVSGSLKLKIT